MNYVVTLTDKKYLKYAQRLHLTVREAGWRGEFVILTTEDDIYANCKVIKVKREHKTNVFDDNRWLQFECCEPFEDGDRVLLLDADMTVLPHCDFDFLFDHDYLMGVVPEEYDVTGELPVLRKMLDKEIDFKYCSPPSVFRVGDERVEKLFKICRECIPIAEKAEGKRGSWFTLNYAMNLEGTPLPMILPKSKLVNTDDINWGNQYERPWFVHFSGGKGKKYWDQEMKGIDLGYEI